MPTEMECDIFAHTDTESAPVIHWVRHIKRKREGERERCRLVYLLRSFVFSVCLSDSMRQMPRSPAKRMSVQLSAEISLLSGGEPELRNLPPLSDFQPNVVLSPHHFARMFLPLLPPFHPFFFPHCHPLSCLSSCTPKFLPFPHYFYTNPPLKSTSASDPVSHA